MSNSLTAFNPEYWARDMQTIFFKESVAIKLANTEMRDLLVMGDTVNKPYRSHLVKKTYTKGADINAQDVSGTNEQLSVATADVVPFYVDDIDKMQNKWDLATKYAQDSQRVLNNVLDQVVLSQYSVAASDVYAADVGGSGATTALTLGTSNVQQIFTAASRKLDQYNTPQAGRFAAIGPHVLETLRLYIGGKDTSMSDVIGNNGKVSERFGFELYYTNNLPWTGTWTPADDPSDAATITIAGVTITFKTTPVAAGQVLRGTSLANTLDNLVALINGTGTGDASDYIDVSDANRFKLSQAGLVATDGTTYASFVGYGDIATATSEALDLWSSQTQHMLCGLKGATDLLVQKSPNVEFRLAEKRLGRFVYPWMLYGYKTFNDMTDALVDVNISTSSWT